MGEKAGEMDEWLDRLADSLGEAARRLLPGTSEAGVEVSRGPA
jgi:hypothetical protein